MARAILTRFYLNSSSNTSHWLLCKNTRSENADRVHNNPTGRARCYCIDNQVTFKPRDHKNNDASELTTKHYYASDKFQMKKICDTKTKLSLKNLTLTNTPKSDIENNVSKQLFLTKLRTQKIKLKPSVFLTSEIIKPEVFTTSEIARRCIHSLPPDIPKMSLAEIKKELKQKGINMVDGYTTLTIQCVLCDTEEKGAMHINKTTGYFSCASCHACGEWSLLHRALRYGADDAAVRGSAERARAEHDAVAKDWQRIVSTTQTVASLDDAAVERLFSMYKWPCTKETVTVLGEARCRSEEGAVYLPLRNCAGGVVGWRKLLGALVTTHGQPGLFTCRAMRQSRSDQAVLVPAVSDILHLAKDRVPGLLVWWYGSALPPAVLPVLEGFRKIVVWGAAESVLAVGDKLNQERCTFVRPIKAATTATEAAGEARAGELRAAVSEAAPAAHRAITSFSALRRDVIANLTNADKVRGVKWTRFPSLTRLLGGHRRGELTVLTGGTGCGKTTLCSEMSLDLAASGVSTLWGSFEIRNTRLAQTMLQQFAGVPLEQNLQHVERFADQFETLPVYFLAFHGAQPVALVMEAVEHARYVHDIAHVVVDNVQFMLGVGEPGDRYFRQDAVIAAFRTFATRRDCHVTLVMHPRKEREADDLSTSSIFGSAKAAQEADNVLIIQDKRLTSVRGKKWLQVAKNRYSGDLGVVPLEFHRDSLSYGKRTHVA